MKTQGRWEIEIQDDEQNENKVIVGANGFDKWTCLFQGDICLCLQATCAQDDVSICRLQNNKPTDDCCGVSMIVNQA